MLKLRTKKKPANIGRSVLINGICLFRARAATAARKANAELDRQYKRLRRVVA